ncbi:MAG: chromosome segregation protein SMC [Coleofasciculaceae cyanobacterium]
MVHIKRVELTNFKSFGGTTKVPLLPEFTVISGPNGSGKSNILDALLFCLSLASSKGMRAERLPDLVNHNKEHRGTVEASVTVTFDLSDFDGELGTQEAGSGGDEGAGEAGEAGGERENPLSSEWSVTRRLRVTKQGSYSSNYYINGESCTQTELHEQLNRLRVYPEGYNVVLQGDVTNIISMKPRERREIIDELAGVAAFDRKINQTKDTLVQVKEREDSCRIIEKELIVQRDRLAADRTKAERYQKLRAELQEKQQWEAVIKYKVIQQQQAQLRRLFEAGEAEEAKLTSQLTSLSAQIDRASTELDELNTRVKALGEEEQVAVASSLATQQVEQRQLQNRQQELSNNQETTEAKLQGTKEEIQQHEQTIERLEQQHRLDKQSIASLISQRDQVQAILNQSRERANAIASASEAWVQEQTSLSRQVETLLKQINPQRTEQAQLQERQSQFGRVIKEQTELLERLEPEIASKQSQLANLEEQLTKSSGQITNLAQSLAAAEKELQLQQQTQKRLFSEQREKQRQLDKLEAQAQAQQEAQGTYATKIILEVGLPGVCGLVAQLGRVEPGYQLALEIAAGARLGNLVVEDDGVAAAGIELLKQKKAGRVTFLPLNKIQAPRFSENAALRYASGFIDYAVNLIDHEARYKNIFAYVFGSTVVFANLSDARPYLGQHRIVTLEGEILEASGAMTGGSRNQRSSLHFGTSDAVESSEMKALKNRLEEIEQILERSLELVTNLSASVKQLTVELAEAKSLGKETQLRREQLDKEINNQRTQQAQVRSQLGQNTQEQQNATERLQILDTELPILEAQLAELRQQLARLEESQTHSEWQEIQSLIKAQESQLKEKEQAILAAEKKLLELENQQQRLVEKNTDSYRRIAEYQTQQQSWQEQQSALNDQLLTIKEQITQTQASLRQLELKLGNVREERDRAEAHLRQLQERQQRRSWQQQKLQETQSARREEEANLQTQLQNQEAELPNPLPEISFFVNGKETGSQNNEPQLISLESLTAQLEQLQKELKNGQKRLEGMEPVNMLALEEYERTNNRLQELSEKLTTLEAERTELLLRVENFTTLRLQAFSQAFDAINENFKTIFAELSDGDGYLQLEDAEDPFNGGLNLVAHPKGKPVRRLASMSGGEKSLTALSFIFALQRYRPSPFYAFDEVDMFLDGANVERLARMIKQQATLAQFIVVSLRRPMIESSERTIGVTQARGAYTQVLGIKLPQKKAIR